MPLLLFALCQLISSFTPTAPSARFSSGGPDTFGTVSAMRVAVLTVDGMFDSGLTTMLDILATANALSGQAGLAGAPFEVTVAGRGGGGAGGGPGPGLGAARGAVARRGNRPAGAGGVPRGWAAPARRDRRL